MSWILVSTNRDFSMAFTFGFVLEIGSKRQQIGCKFAIRTKWQSKKMHEISIVFEFVRHENLTFSGHLESLVLMLDFT